MKFQIMLALKGSDGGANDSTKSPDFHYYSEIRIVWTGNASKLAGCSICQSHVAQYQRKETDWIEKNV